MARFGAPLSVVRPPSPVVELDDDVDTGVVLTPALLAAIRSIAPARRRSKLPYVIAAALFAAAVAVGLNPELRDFIATKVHLSLSVAPQRGAVHTGL